MGTGQIYLGSFTKQPEPACDFRSVGRVGPFLFSHLQARILHHPTTHHDRRNRHIPPHAQTHRAAFPIVDLLIGGV